MKQKTLFFITLLASIIFCSEASALSEKITSRVVYLEIFDFKQDQKGCPDFKDRLTSKGRMRRGPASGYIAGEEFHYYLISAKHVLSKKYSNTSTYPKRCVYIITEKGLKVFVSEYLLIWDTPSNVGPIPLTPLEGLDISLIRVFLKGAKFEQPYEFRTQPIDKKGKVYIGQNESITYGGYFLDGKDYNNSLKLEPVRNKANIKHGNCTTFEVKCNVDEIISGGYSGGPVLDQQGKLIGINSSRNENLKEGTFSPIFNLVVFFSKINIINTNTQPLNIESSAQKVSGTIKAHVVFHDHDARTANFGKLGIQSAFLTPFDSNTGDSLSDDKIKIYYKSKYENGEPYNWEWNLSGRNFESTKYMLDFTTTPTAISNDFVVPSLVNLRAEKINQITLKTRSKLSIDEKLSADRFYRVIRNKYRKRQLSKCSRKGIFDAAKCFYRNEENLYFVESIKSEFEDKIVSRYELSTSYLPEKTVTKYFEELAANAIKIGLYCKAKYYIETYLTNNQYQLRFVAPGDLTRVGGICLALTLYKQNPTNGFKHYLDPYMYAAETINSDTRIKSVLLRKKVSSGVTIGITSSAISNVVESGSISGNGGGGSGRSLLREEIFEQLR